MSKQPAKYLEVMDGLIAAAYQSGDTHQDGLRAVFELGYDEGGSDTDWTAG